jgi:OmpA-OmpF porin, OOP family
MRPQFSALICALGVTVPTLVHAESPPDGDAAGDASLSLSGELNSDGADADLDAGAESTTETSEQARKWNPRKDQRWIERWRPEAGMVELGIYAGVFLLNRRHELFRPNLDLPLQGWQPLRELNPTIGGRVGYYPSRFVGVEAEGGAVLTQLDDGTSVVPFTVRGHVIAQLGLWSVTPFVLVGGGLLGVNNAGPLGTDIDPSMHFGGGVKIYINRWVMLRLDVRDVISHMQGVENTFESHNLEATLGLSFTLNRRNTPQPRERQIADLASPPGDRDGDGIPDDVDQCPDDPETFNDYQDEDGCPEYDRDGDGFYDDQDLCPDEAGVAPDGCPIRDTDGDGIYDDVDQCPTEPETFNDYMDEDGCPDELPEEIKRFTGNIKGITFDTNKATIRKTSIPVLDEAVKVLQQFPSVRIEVGGHTDSQGKHEHNMKLSRERADSVKSYLVGMGVAEDRIETAGYGPDVPIDTNATKDGRANNRRIEFRIIGGGARPSSN